MHLLHPHNHPPVQQNLPKLYNISHVWARSRQPGYSQAAHSALSQAILLQLHSRDVGSNLKVIKPWAWSVVGAA